MYEKLIPPQKMDLAFSDSYPFEGHFFDYTDDLSIKNKRLEDQNKILDKASNGLGLASKLGAVLNLAMGNDRGNFLSYNRLSNNDLNVDNSLVGTIGGAADALGQVGMAITGLIDRNSERKNGSLEHRVGLYGRGGNLFSIGGSTVDPADVKAPNLGAGVNSSSSSNFSIDGAIQTGAALLGNAFQQAQIKDTTGVQQGIVGAQTSAAPKNDSWDSLEDSYANTPWLRKLKARDVRNGSIMGDVFNSISAAGQGALAGSKIGGLGAIPGAAIGAGSGIIGSVIGAIRANKQKIKLNKLIAFTNKFNQNSLENRANNIMENNQLGLDANFAAFGGSLMTHGSDFTNGVSIVGEGGMHEENPNGGIQVGVDSQGTPNLVEEGEVIWNDFVFSNRIDVPEEAVKVFKLGKRGMSFSDAAKKIQKSAEEMPNDPIAKRSMNRNLALLAELQEALKQAQEEQAQVDAANQRDQAIIEHAIGGPLFTAHGDLTKDTKKFFANYYGEGGPWGNTDVSNNWWDDSKRDYTSAYTDLFNDNSWLYNYYTKNAYKDGKGNEVSWEDFINPEKSYARDKKAGPAHNYVRDALIRTFGPTGDLYKERKINRYRAGWKPEVDSLQDSTNFENFKTWLGNNEGNWIGKAADKYKDWSPAVWQQNLSDYSWGTAHNIFMNYLASKQGTPSSINPSSAYELDGYSLPRGWEHNFEYVPTFSTYNNYDRYASLGLPTSLQAPKGINGWPDNWRDSFKTGYESENSDAGAVAADASVTPGNSRFDLTDLRYVPALGAAYSVLRDIFDGGPDYTNANAVMNAGNSVRDVGYKPIGDYMAYDPMDRQYAINQLNAASNAGLRSALDLAGGNRGVAAALALQADRDYMNKLGDIYRKAEEYNRNMYEKTLAFNRETNKTNSDYALEAAKANSARDNLKFNAVLNAARIRDEIDKNRAVSRSTNLTNLFNSIGDIGREQMAFNMVNSNGAELYNIDRHGNISYKKAYYDLAKKDPKTAKEVREKAEAQKASLIDYRGLFGTHKGINYNA